MKNIEKETEGMLVQLMDVNCIHAHPQNPRKDLGDLEELSQSIKENGILQNLTVVPGPAEGEYTVIIGHRRLAASKLAGLTTVPVKIEEMSEKKQIQTMLMENVLREDLTPYEQAQSFQLMLDMGSSEDDIAVETGLSKTTVKKRIALLEFDSEAFKEADERGANLEDYALINQKLTDPELKNKVLRQIGTNNFDYVLREAEKTEAWYKARAKIVQRLDEYAERVDSKEGYVNEGVRHQWYADVFPKPEDADICSYFYHIDADGKYVYLLKSQDETADDTSDEEADETSEEQAKREKEAEAEQKLKEAENERQSQLEQLAKDAYAMRHSFVKNYPGRKKDLRLAVESFLWMIDDYFDIECCGLTELLAVDEESFKSLDELVYGKDDAYVSKVLFALTYCQYDDGDKTCTDYSSWEFMSDPELIHLYSVLEKFGYKTSDAEKQMLDGTHPLYQKLTIESMQEEADEATGEDVTDFDESEDGKEEPEDVLSKIKEERITTPRGTFAVYDGFKSKDEMRSLGWGQHHTHENYTIYADGQRAIAIEDKTE